jgi:hypothetical protein
MALAVLFTHETDYLSKIQPQNLEAELKGVAAGIASYAPVFVTQDEGVRYVRATKTSQIQACEYSPQNQTIDVLFSGYADVPTSFYVFYDLDGEIQSTMVQVSAFQRGSSITYPLSDHQTPKE